MEVRRLSGREVNLRREGDYITDCASRGETRIVTLGELLLFSTDGYAWMFDAADALATPVASLTPLRPLVRVAA